MGPGGGGTVAAVLPTELVGPAVAGVVESEIDESVALFHPGTGRVYVLNPSAADVWRLSDGELTFDQMVAALASSYATEPQAIRDDVAAAVQRLREDGLLAPGGE